MRDDPDRKDIFATLGRCIEPASATSAVSRAAASFARSVETPDEDFFWRFWTDDETDTHLSDWQWAHRQAAEAQNHIFDRFVSTLFFFSVFPY